MYWFDIKAVMLMFGNHIKIKLENDWIKKYIFKL